MWTIIYNYYVSCGLSFNNNKQFRVLTLRAVLQLLHADAVVSGADEPIPMVRDNVWWPSEQDHHVRDSVYDQNWTGTDGHRVQRWDKSVGVHEHRHHWYRVYTDQSYRAAVRQQTRTQVFFRFEQFMIWMFILDCVTYNSYNVYGYIDTAA